MVSVEWTPDDHFYEKKANDIKIMLYIHKSHYEINKYKRECRSGLRKSSVLAPS